MVNSGYQQTDKDFINYDLWNLEGESLQVRGPKPKLNEKYFSTIGAAQTFGRFCELPYGEILKKLTGFEHLNFGFSGAGPSFFNRRPRLIETINEGECCIVQVMSGRSVSNDWFELGQNQGTLRKRGSGGPFEFAEDAYKELMKRESVTKLAEIREQTQDRYVAEYRELAERITVPKILLYFSVRTPGKLEVCGNLGQYWGAFPHFVDTDVLARIKGFFTDYVEVVSNRGMPQTIINKFTGEEVLLWDEASFPNIRYRSHNLYYPSPQMQLDAALATLEPLRAVMGGWVQKAQAAALSMSGSQALERQTSSHAAGASEVAIKRSRDVAHEEQPLANFISAPGTIPEPVFTLPAEEAALLRAEYARASEILEYGSGGSTIYASKLFGKRVISVESSREWMNKVTEYLQQEPGLTPIEFYFTDIGPVGDWGYPTTDARWRNYVDYSFGVWRNKPNFAPDLILIDGRFRTACFAATLLSTRKACTILFADYVNRTNYHVVEKMLRPTAFHGNLARFSVEPDHYTSLSFPELFTMAADPR